MDVRGWIMASLLAIGMYGVIFITLALGHALFQ